MIRMAREQGESLDTDLEMYQSLQRRLDTCGTLLEENQPLPHQTEIKCTIWKLDIEENTRVHKFDKALEGLGNATLIVLNGYGVGADHDSITYIA